MRDVKKIIFVILVLSLLLAAQAYAYMPNQRGAGYPKTVWSDKVKGTVSGKVVTSMDQAKGIQGAYVAIVDTMNQGKELANTTTDANGNFKFASVNATYSSVLLKGPDGTGDSYQQQGMNAYMVYVNISSGDNTGEGYSGSFGVDTNHSNYATGNIVIYAGIPNPDDFATPEPTAQPTPVVTPAPTTPTPEPTPTPAPQGLPVGSLAAGAVLVVALLVLIAIGAYYLFLRKK